MAKRKKFEHDLTTQGGRLRWARDEKELSQAQAGERYGWNVNTYKAHESNRNGIPQEDAKRYAQAFRVNWVWILTGVGTAESKPETDVPVETSNFVRLREIDVYAGAGGGGEVQIGYAQQKNGTWAPAEGVKAEAYFPYDWITTLGLDPKLTDLVRIRGDSMWPEIDDGDWVFVDRRVQRLNSDDIYLLWDGYGVVAKSLAIVRSSQPPRVKIISANPKYSPDEVLLDEINIIGRIGYRLGRIVRR